MTSKSNKSGQGPANAKPPCDQEHNNEAPDLFSYRIAVEQVAETGSDFAIEASADEREKLAAFNGLIAIDKLEAVFHVVPRPGQRFNVSGRLMAAVTQTCVVSLDPFETEIAEDIEVDFAPAGESAKIETAKAQSAKPKMAKPGLVRPGTVNWGLVEPQFENMASYEGGTGQDAEEDPPDIIIDGKIDLGAIACEFLALALDPYPRKPDARFEYTLTGTSEGPESPFSILRKLDKTS